MQHVQLHNEQDAIKQAVEAGYDSRHLRFCYPVKDAEVNEHCNSEIFSDPAFWQALGKARGWGEQFKFGSISFWDIGKVPMVKETWKYYALRYFETLLSNGDRSAYWASLP